jgi:hypothetical protein
VHARCLLAITLCVAAWPAQAQGNAVVLGQSLALAGGVGGVCAGLVAGYLSPRPLRFWTSFGIYLGVLCMVASTWAQSMDIVPLTLVLGALFGLLPYGLCFFLVRRGLGWLRARILGPRDH